MGNSAKQDRFLTDHRWEVALPIRKLVADGVISAKGSKRSTTYFTGRKAAKN
ncbi:MAG: hypothetical protein ABIY55_36125 [Kofleriaceae bacterium]